MHYRKLKKVPATGWVEEKAFAGRKDIPSAAPEKENDPAVAVPVYLPSPVKRTDNKHAYQNRIGNRTQPKVLPVKTAVKKSLIQRKPAITRKRGDGSVFLIFLFLMLGIALVLTGITMIVTGIAVITWWLIVLGVVVIFLGLIPFLGMISFMFGDHYRPAPAYDESQKHSVFPDNK